MPFAIAALGDIVWTLFLFALALAVVEFGNFLRALMPKIPWYLRWLDSAVLFAVNGASNFLMGAAQGSLHRLRDLAVDLAHIDSRIIGAVVGVLDHLGTQASHLYRDVIPQAQSDAQTYAHGQVAAEQGRALSAESTLRTDLANAKSVESSFEAYVRGPYHNALEADVRAAEDASTATSEAWAENQLTALQADLMNRLALVWQAIAPLQTAVSSTIPAELAAQAAKETSDISAETQDRIASLNAAVASLTTQIDVASTKQSQALAAQAAAEASARAADLSTAEGVAASDQANAEAAAQSALASQAAADKASLASAVGTLQGQITSLQSVQTLTLPSLPNVALPEAITIPVAVGALAAAVTGVITEVADCMVSTCEGPNNVSNVLRNLLGVLTAAGEVGFIAEAIKNPAGTANAIAPALDAISGGAISTLDAILTL